MPWQQVRRATTGGVAPPTILPLAPATVQVTKPSLRPPLAELEQRRHDPGQFGQRRGPTRSGAPRLPRRASPCRRGATPAPPRGTPPPARDLSAARSACRGSLPPGRPRRHVPQCRARSRLAGQRRGCHDRAYVTAAAAAAAAALRPPGGRSRLPGSGGNRRSNRPAGPPPGTAPEWRWARRPARTAPAEPLGRHCERPRSGCAVEFVATGRIGPVFRSPTDPERAVLARLTRTRTAARAAQPRERFR